MSDFCITAIRYSTDGKHIDYVQVREEIVSKNQIGEPRTVARAFVADLIRLKKATFQTRVVTKDYTWAVGAQVHVIDEVYLSTDRNSTKKDNLGNLPSF